MLELRQQNHHPVLLLAQAESGGTGCCLPCASGDRTEPGERALWKDLGRGVSCSYIRDLVTRFLPISLPM